MVETKEKVAEMMQEANFVVEKTIGQ